MYLRERGLNLRGSIPFVVESCKLAVPFSDRQVLYISLRFANYAVAKEASLNMTPNSGETCSIDVIHMWLIWLHTYLRI